MKPLVAVLVSVTVLLVPGGLMVTAQASDGVSQVRGYVDDDPPSDDASDGDPSEGDPSEGDPSEGDPSEGDPSEGDPSEGDPSEGDPSDGDDAESEPIFDGDPDTLLDEILDTGEFAGDPDDPLMLAEGVAIDVDGADIENVWVESQEGDSAGLEIDADGVSLEGIDIRGEADAGLDIDGDGIDVRDSVIRGGTATTLSIAAGSRVSVEASMVGFPQGAGATLLTIVQGNSATPTRIDVSGVEFCESCYERHLDPQAPRGGPGERLLPRQNMCATCIFLPGCNGGTARLNAFMQVQFGDQFRAKPGSVTIDARGIYWGPGGPRMAGNPRGKGLRIPAIRGVKVNVRPWLVSVAAPPGSTITARGATREQHFDDRTVVLVPQGTLVTVRHLGRSMTIKPRVDTVISRVR
ncbi:MAG: hypothetical protein ACKOYQ_05255 [Actinomycetota bacterium]